MTIEVKGFDYTLLRDGTQIRVVCSNCRSGYLVMRVIGGDYLECPRCFANYPKYLVRCMECSGLMELTKSLTFKCIICNREEVINKQDYKFAGDYL